MGLQRSTSHRRVGRRFRKRSKRPINKRTFSQPSVGKVREHPKVLGLPLRPSVHFVLGESVDWLLAKRLGMQHDSIACFLVPSLGTSRGRARNQPGFWSSRYLDFRRERPNRSDPPWVSMRLPISLRKLKPIPIVRERHVRLPIHYERIARAWLTGIIAFSDSFTMPDLQKYVGRMSNSSLTFVRTPSRAVVHGFVKACINGAVKYINIFGSAVNRNLSEDPLLKTVLRTGMFQHTRAKAKFKRTPGNINLGPDGNMSYEEFSRHVQGHLDDEDPVMESQSLRLP